MIIIDKSSDIYFSWNSALVRVSIQILFLVTFDTVSYQRILAYQIQFTTHRILWLQFTTFWRHLHSAYLCTTWSSKIHEQQWKRFPLIEFPNNQHNRCRTLLITIVCHVDSSCSLLRKEAGIILLTERVMYKQNFVFEI